MDLKRTVRTGNTYYRLEEPRKFTRNISKAFLFEYDIANRIVNETQNDVTVMIPEKVVNDMTTSQYTIKIKTVKNIYNLDEFDEFTINNCKVKFNLGAVNTIIINEEKYMYESRLDMEEDIIKVVGEQYNFSSEDIRQFFDELYIKLLKGGLPHQY